MDIRKVVDDPEWQRLRASFVGTWKDTPEYNVRRLRGYLERRANTPEAPLAYRRVLNYLTGSGFRLGIIDHPDITALRDEVRALWSKKMEE